MIDPKELSRRFTNYYQSSRPIYENHSPIYGNDAPICHNFESAFRYILDVSPETYEKIVNLINSVFDVAKSKTLLFALDVILENCPEEYKKIIEIIKDYLKSLLEDN